MMTATNAIASCQVQNQKKKFSFQLLLTSLWQKLKC